MNKKERVKILLRGKVCVRCGTDQRLHFHHIDPSTKLYQITRCPVEFLEAEVKKCILLCTSCHTTVHNAKDMLSVTDPNAYAKRWRDANKEKVKESVNRCQEKNREKYNRNQKERYYQNLEKSRKTARNWYRKKHGLPLDD